MGKPSLDNRRKKSEDPNEPDIFLRKKPKKPTNDPNFVKYPGRSKADVGAYWNVIPDRYH